MLRRIFHFGSSPPTMRTALSTTALVLCATALGMSCQSAVPAQKSAGKSSSHTGGSSSKGGTNSLGDAGGAPPQPSDSLTLISVTAHVDGRQGQRVRLSVAGKQTSSGFASVGVTALDANGNPIYWYSTRHDSQLDSPTGYLVPQTAPTGTNFSFDIVVPFSNMLLDWAQAQVSLFDRDDAVSNDLLVPVQSQPVRSSGQSCDPTSKLDRCGSGLDCSTTSSTCVNHTGPTLTQAAYLTTANGPLMLALGTDNADDADGMSIDFFDVSGAPVQVDMDNDPSNPRKASSFLESAGFTAMDGQFIFNITPSDTFTAIVKKVGLTPSDALGIRGATLSVPLTPQPSRSSGQTCDIYGFDYCSSGTVCSPGLPGARNTCLPIVTMQGNECAAPVLDISHSPALVTGYSQGASAWDPPTDCTSSNNVNEPESVIKLHVPTSVASITLSTDRRETQFDTILYVASSCGVTSPKILGCNDDGAAGNLTLTLVLTNVSAGDYYVIVDSGSGGGGPFGLVATVP